MVSQEARAYQPLIFEEGQTWEIAPITIYFHSGGEECYPSHVLELLAESSPSM